MLLLNRRMALAAGGAAAATALLPFRAQAEAHAAGPLIHTAGPQAGVVNSTVVLGEEKALVIDAQFVRPEAEALVAMIEATGRDVETVFVTHFHPDHHFGVAVVKARWPDARIVAHPQVAAMLGRMGRGMFEARKSAMGDLLPEDWIAPAPLDGGALLLEGERFDILEPMQGDTAMITPVRLPQFDALVAADILFNGTHPFLAEATTPEAIAAWRASLDDIETIDAGVLIPGHRTEDTAYDASGIAHTRQMLDYWEAALEEASDAESLREAYLSRAGDLPLGGLLDRAVEAAFAE